MDEIRIDIKEQEKYEEYQDKLEKEEKISELAKDILKSSVHFPMTKTPDELTKNAFLMAERFYLEQE